VFIGTLSQLTEVLVLVLVFYLGFFLKKTGGKILKFICTKLITSRISSTTIYMGVPCPGTPTY
jgi:hypothetical protein